MNYLRCVLSQLLAWVFLLNDVKSNYKKRDLHFLQTLPAELTDRKTVPSQYGGLVVTQMDDLSSERAYHEYRKEEK
jgi:hypothetical protein